jgi:hypothetical protein
MFALLPNSGKSREIRRSRRGRPQQRWNRSRLEVLADRLALSGTSFYVAVTGNDNNNGLSPGHPFASIQQGLDMANNPGDIVYVEGGTYDQPQNLNSDSNPLTLSSSGNAQAPITLTNYEGQHVVINASSNVSGLANDTAIDVYSASFFTISGLDIDNNQNGQEQDAEGVTIEGNSSHIALSDDNDTLGVGDGQLWIQDASNCVVANNIFDAVGNEMLVFSYPDVTTNPNIQLDYNLYYTPLGKSDPSAFTWTWAGAANQNSYRSFAAYQSGVHEDAHSQFANPNFVNAAAANFALGAGSPALAAGTSKSLWYAPKSFTGQTRTLPPNVGAY